MRNGGLNSPLQLAAERVQRGLGERRRGGAYTSIQVLPMKGAVPSSKLHAGQKKLES